MHVDEKAGRVGLDLLDIESSPSVGGCAGDVETSLERSSHATDSPPDTAVSIDRDRVGEGDSGRAALSARGFVKVSGSDGRAKVVATKVVQGDVVTDGVAVTVQAQEVCA